MSDTFLIEADKVLFRPPFIPQDIKLENSDSTLHGIRFESDLKMGVGKNIVHQGGWEQRGDGNTIEWYHNDVLMMKLE